MADIITFLTTNPAALMLGGVPIIVMIRVVIVIKIKGGDNK